jgi:hypothetical protein
VDRGIQADCKIAWVRFNRVVFPFGSSVGFCEEAVVYIVLGASTLRKEGEVPK